MSSPKQKTERVQLVQDAGLILSIFLILCLPRLIIIKQSVTIDEHKWLSRSYYYNDALVTADWDETYQAEHPGVTTMWAGTLGLNILFQQTGIFFDPTNHPDLKTLLQANGVKPLDALAGARAIMILLNGVVLTLAFIYARRLMGTAVAVTGFLLIAFNPFHAAHTHILHLDGLAGSFIFLSLLAFLHFGESRRWRDLLISGITAGLGWLTKSPAVVIIPVIILLSAGQIWGQGQNKDGRWGHILRQYVAYFFVWMLAGGLIFTIIWPAMWVSPVNAVVSVFLSAFLYASGGHYQPIFFNGAIFSASDSLAQLRFFYPITYLWRSTIINLAGLVLVVIAFLRRRPPLDSHRRRTAVLGLILFVLIFLILVSASTKKFDRYLLPVYPPLDLLAAAGWVAVGRWVSQFRPTHAGRWAGRALLITLILIQASFLLGSYPYYLSYYNPLLGGNRRAPQVMMIGWGEGLDAAARYLNSKPDAGELGVASWYDESFAYFFDGETLNLPSVVSPELKEKILAADYIVIYAHQWQRNLPANILDILRPLTPVHIINFNGLEYARIYATP